ncbi:MAG: twin-arginine translocase TatA/TatE family subunit [Phycisphaerales bacterium]|nr:twin-arginine translocase TatA/TatE family subunit [Phycisphaerales bacterium]
MLTLGLFQNIGPLEGFIILGIALLLFGRRLPEVGRSMGRGIVEFKKGLKGIDDDIETESGRAAAKNKPILSADTGSSTIQTPAPPADARVSRSDTVE